MGFAMRMNFVDVVVSDSLKHYYVVTDRYSSKKEKRGSNDRK